MSAGRPAALPAAGYTLPQRLFMGEGECRVRVLPEDGGSPADIDLTVLPVSRELQEWLAVAVLGATGPSGPRRSVVSALDILSILKRFTRYLATLQRPPTRPDQLRRAHLDGFILAGGNWLHRDLGSLRSTLRFAPDLPTEFWARLTQATVPRSDGAVRSYSEAEFRRITQAAREQLRAAAGRIRHARGVLELWRDGNIERSDHARWEQGWLLDYLDRHGDVPRSVDARARFVPTTLVVRHGGPNAVIGGLHLTYADIAAAAVLLLCLTGQNLGTIDTATTNHHRPDAHAGGPATAVIELVKPRRGSRHAAMTVALQDAAAGGEQAGGLGSGRDDLVTPFGVYTLLIDLARDTRRWLGTDRLIAFYNAKGKTGRGLRVGVPKQSLQLWSATTGLECDPPAVGEQDAEDPAAPRPLVIDARRLRLTWLEIHQRPVAQTEHTLANEYLARNRGNIAEYQQLVANVLQQQVDGARAHRPIPVLTQEDVERAAVDPQAVATAHGLTVARLQDLIAGRLDTVMAGCTDNLDSPHTAPGRPCTASFLLCLSCPCARAGSQPAAGTSDRHRPHPSSKVRSGTQRNGTSATRTSKAPANAGAFSISSFSQRKNYLLQHAENVPKDQLQQSRAPERSAGQQSTTLLLLAVHGRIRTFDAAVFADTGWETLAVYQHLNRLRGIAESAGIEVVRVSAGHIRADALDPAHRFASMPLFTLGPDGQRGMARRQCTSVLSGRPAAVSGVSDVDSRTFPAAWETPPGWVSLACRIPSRLAWRPYVLPMRPQRVISPSSGRVSWTVVGPDLTPVAPVEQFLAYLSATERSPLTVKAYAHDLAVYFRFLAERGLTWDAVCLDDLTQYIFWLRKPAAEVIVLDVGSAGREPGTVNRMLSAVSAFYGHHARAGIAVADQLTTWRRIARRDYKPFLHHVTKGRPVKTSALRLRTRRRLPKTLTCEQVQALLDACDRLRDRFLLALLYETGMRIGQALGLRQEDMRTWERTVAIVPRDDNANEARAKTRREHEVHVSAELCRLFGDYMHLEYGELDSDYVFVNLWGGQVGAALRYETVADLVKRLRRRTGIAFHLHQLRHTHATELLRGGVRIEVASKRLTHASTQTTESFYDHLTVEDTRQQVEQFWAGKGVRS